MNLLVERQDDIRAAFALRLHTVEPTLTRVRHHHNFFALAANLAVEPIFDPAEALFVEVDKTQHVGSKVALRVDALILFLEVNAFQIQRFHCFFPVGRHFAGNPNEALRGAQFCFQHVTGDSQHAREQLGRKLRISDFDGHGKHRVHRNAHGQRIPVAVVDGTSLGSDFDGALLLPSGAGEVFAVTEQL